MIKYEVHYRMTDIPPLSQGCASFWSISWGCASYLRHRRSLLGYIRRRRSLHRSGDTVYNLYAIRG